MKKYLFILGLLLTTITVFSQTSDYKVVFDLTSKDSVNQMAAIRWVKEIIQADPAASVEVVMYGKGVYLATKDKSYFAQNVSELASQKNVSFKVCEVALKNLQIDKKDLIAGVGWVPDGIKEVIDKQHAGYGYIKVTVN